MHELANMGKCGISVYDRLIYNLRPAIETELLHLVLAIHLVEENIGVLAGGFQHSIHAVCVGMQFIAYEQMVRIVAAYRFGGALIVAIDAGQQKLDIIAGFIRVAKSR